MIKFDIDREINQLLKDVLCKILYEAKTSVDVEEELEKFWMVVIWEFWDLRREGLCTGNGDI